MTETINDVQTSNADNGSANATPLTFDDILTDPEYQAEFDRRFEQGFNKRLEKEKAKWEKEAAEQRTEAERLASMSAEEKHQHEIEKLQKIADEANGKLNAYELKDAAQRIAASKGLDISLLNLLDYKNETAETIKAKIDDIELAYKKAVEKAVNEKLRQVSPEHRTESHISAEQKYLDEKYGKSNFYNK